MQDLQGYEQLARDCSPHRATTSDRIVRTEVTGDTTIWSILMVRKTSLIIRQHGTNQKAELRNVDFTGWPVMWGDAQVQLFRPLNLPETGATAVKRTRPVIGESKIAKCKQIYASNPTFTREQMIAAFIAEAACTPAGAVTYFLTCKKG